MSTAPEAKKDDVKAAKAAKAPKAAAKTPGKVEAPEAAAPKVAKAARKPAAKKAGARTNGASAAAKRPKWFGPASPPGTRLASPMIPRWRCAWAG